MLPRHPDTMSDNDLRAWLAHLVNDHVPESKYLDYKREVDVRKDRKEIAKDVSSFANEYGGTLVYGIDEERAASGPPVPKRGPYGLDAVPNFEESVENILVETIRPALPDVRVKTVEVAEGKYIY